MPSGKRNSLGFGERRGGEPAALALVDDRRVEALLDRRPDAERRGEGEALDHQVAAVAHADLVDRREQVVGGVAGDDVGEARLDAHADERQQAALGPLSVRRELRRAEHDADLVVGVGRMRRRQVHGHVEVVAPGGRTRRRRSAG